MRFSNFFRVVIFVAAGALASAATIAAQDLEMLSSKLRSGSIEEKRDALMIIRGIRSADASRVALPALRDKDPMVRATAAASVIFMPTSEASSALVPLLTDKDEFVRREGAYAFGEVGDPSTASCLIRSLTTDKSPEVRTAAAVAIGKVANADSISSLLAVFDPPPTEDNEMLRRAAARSIGQIAQILRSGKRQVLTPQNFLPENFKDIGPKPSPELLAHFTKAVSVLARLLDSRNESDDTRREAAFALGAIGDQAAEPVLSKYVSSSDIYLAEIVKEALLKLKAAE